MKTNISLNKKSWILADLVNSNIVINLKCNFGIKINKIITKIRYKNINIYYYKKMNIAKSKKVKIVIVSIIIYILYY